jgi:hypothetical protein
MMELGTAIVPELNQTSSPPKMGDMMPCSPAKHTICIISVEVSGFSHSVVEAVTTFYLNLLADCEA